jgi:hypothetical protein
MESTHELKTIPDDELLRRLAELLRQSRHTEADLVAHVGEVDARRLYAREASPSMFAYCTEVLHLSGAEAYLRIAAARASREHPVLLEMLADGRLHLTAIAMLAPRLTAGNRDTLLARATHKSKREIEELLAALAPRPDVAASMRKLPASRVVTPPASALRFDPGEATPRAAPSPPGLDRAAAGLELGPDGVAPHELELRPDGVAPHEVELRPDGVALSRHGVESAPLQLRPDEVATPPSAGHARRVVVEPLAPARYRVQFTASADLHDKLERLRALMRSSVPDGDLAAIIDRAVTEKLERLESRRFGRNRVPRKILVAGNGSPSAGKDSPAAGTGSSSAGKGPAATGDGSRSTESTPPTTRHIPAAVRRAVYERDGGRCGYVDERDRRCTAREGLEFHHRRPFGHGGGHSVENISLACRAHNAYLAVVDYGRKAMAPHRRSRERTFELRPCPSL